MIDREGVDQPGQTALEELGVSDEFNIGLVVGGTMVRTLELKGWEDQKSKYFVVVLEKDVLTENEGLTSMVSINLVRKTETSDFDPFAHVDSRLVGDRENRRAEAVGSYSNMGTYKKDLDEDHLTMLKLSDDKKDCIRAVLNRKEKELDVAVKVDEIFKGLGVGEDLWVISMAILEILGARVRIIKVDATKGKKLGAEYESFYQRMGGKPILHLEKTIEGEGLDASQLWECSTKLSAGQFQRLKGIILPK